MGSYRIERDERACRIFIEGEFTATLTPDLQSSLKQEVEQPAEEFVFDLAQTDMVDSSGIGLLIALGNTLVRTRGTMKVVNVSPEILHLFRSMRLLSRLNVSASSPPEGSLA